jgi:hypothetical protein
MKIYVDNLIVQHVTISNIDKFFSSQDKEIKIYSETGIFKIVGNKTMKLSYVDKPIENDALDKITLTVDNSYEKLDDEYFQIPFHHYTEDKTIRTYELRKNAELKLIVELIDGGVIDIYFTTKGNLHTIGIKDDIFSFLSMLKFNNSI